MPRRRIWRGILLIHRYLGIGLSLVILLWCTSGIVLMYVQYPALDHGERLRGLPKLDLSRCCASPAEQRFEVIRVAVETGPRGSLAHLVLRNGEVRSLDLQSGRLIDRWQDSALTAAGTAFAAEQGWAEPDSAIWTDRDQWTVHGRFDIHRPLLRFANSDGRQWYLSSRTAEVIQSSTGFERFWSWPGAITHWIYPTLLRQHTGVWAEVVIWLTLFGLFLTLTGIAIGVGHFRWRSAQDRSPYRGWWLWHHYLGLAFGLMTLIWLGSGLLSMNPWGALEGRSVARERALLNGLDKTLEEVVESIRSVLPHVPPDTVQLQSAAWLGSVYFLAWNKQGRATRLSSRGRSPSLRVAEIADATERLGIPDAQIDSLNEGDDYYFSHHDAVEFPVYRIITPSAERYYLSATSGRLLIHLDSGRLWYRWLFEGLHRGDFHQLIRQRPLWDVAMLVLLLGVTSGALTGVFLAWRRIRLR